MILELVLIAATVAIQPVPFAQLAAQREKIHAAIMAEQDATQLHALMAEAARLDSILDARDLEKITQVTRILQGK